MSQTESRQRVLVLTVGTGNPTERLPAMSVPTVLSSADARRQEKFVEGEEARHHSLASATQQPA